MHVRRQARGEGAAVDNRVPPILHALSLLRTKAARKPATVISPAKSCAIAKASGIMVSANIARIPPAATAMVPATTSDEKC